MSRLSLQNLNVWYPVKSGIFARTRDHVKAVNGVSLDVNSGETLGLVGESGCGKTSLGRAILGLEKVHSGGIFLDDVELSRLTPSQWRHHRRRIQMVFQDPFSSLNPRMTAMELLTEGLAYHGLLNGRNRKEAAAELMLDVGLEPETMHRYPHEFSGGQRQRLSIARAISLKPEFIVCDEPVSALDVSVQAQVLNLLADLKQKHNLAYLFISHDINVVRHISDRIAVMHNGEIVESGPAEEVFGNPRHEYTKHLLSAVLPINKHA